MRRYPKPCLLVVLTIGLCAAVVVPSAEAQGEKKVQEGKPVPEFTLPTTNIARILPAKKDATTLSMKDVKGKNVILFFYPKAMTPGCTIESCGFRDKIEQFAQLNTVVIGISTDKLEDQQKFTEKEKLNFPLMADADKEVAKTFGVLNATRGFANRETVVIDTQGIVRKIYTKVDPATHPDEVLTFVKNNLANKK
jgi:peroxiredoxin Q/BCP